MALPDRKARRAALWLVYALDVTGGSVDEALDAAHYTVDELQRGHAWETVERIVRGVSDRWDELNETVQAVSPRWRVERMAHIDRNILRIGAWEMLHADHPPRAVINACVELAKEYGDKGTPAFVNGLLDQICRDHSIKIR